MTTFSAALLRFYEHKPDQVCIYLQTAGQPDLPIAYRDLLQGAATFSHLLADAGIQPGEVVILILQHSLELIHAYFGVILHGTIPSIMPFLTEKLLPERYRADLASLVAITRPSAIITYPDFETEVRAALRPGDSVRSVILTSQAGPPVGLDFSNFGGLSRQPEDIVLLQHSSGTTGLQKGVALSHRAVFNQLETYGRALHLQSDDVVVSWLPLYHDMGLIAGFLQPILSGLPLVLMSPFDWVRAPQRLLQAVSRYRGTLSWLPNFAYNFCATRIRDRHLDGVDLSSWRAVSNCSEPMRFESHRIFLERFQSLGLRPQALTTCYAMAENVFAVTQGGIDFPVTVDEIDRDAFQEQRRAINARPGAPSIRMLSAGPPIPGTQVRVVSQKGESLPDRHVGELALKSDCMLTGYYQRPDETVKAFLDGWFLTGDYGYMANGEVYISGRNKDLIIVGGKNIYPQDLETLAMEVAGVHPGRVTAFGLYSEDAGTEEVVIVAEVETQEPGDLDRISRQVREAVNRGSAVVLADVHLVGPGWMVKTSSGKNARLSNRDKYLQETRSQ